MDSQASFVSSSSSQLEVSAGPPEKEDEYDPEPPEEPLCWDGPSISLLGLVIAIATIGIPFGAVLTDRPLGGLIKVPTAYESDGSKSTPTISFTRTSQSFGGDTSRQQE